MPKKVAKKRVKKNKGQIETVVNTTNELKVPTLADKKYIRANYNKISEEQIAKDTGLTLSQISELVTSPELDDVDLSEGQKEKPINLRRFAKVHGTIQMTSAQAALDDKILRESGASKSPQEIYGKDCHKVEFKRENITR